MGVAHSYVREYCIRITESIINSHIASIGVTRDVTHLETSAARLVTLWDGCGQWVWFKYRHLPLSMARRASRDKGRGCSPS